VSAAVPRREEEARLRAPPRNVEASWAPRRDVIAPPPPGRAVLSYKGAMKLVTFRPTGSDAFGSGICRGRGGSASSSTTAGSSTSPRSSRASPASRCSTRWITRTSTCRSSGRSSRWRPSCRAPRSTIPAASSSSRRSRGPSPCATATPSAGTSRRRDGTGARDDPRVRPVSRLLLLESPHGHRPGELRVGRADSSSSTSSSSLCVIGKKVTNPSVAEADDAIFGYGVLNDFSARALQTEEMKLNLGPAKGKDFATAMGPGS